MSIKVAVMCRNSEGAPDIVMYQIDCSKEDYDNGDHYMAASDQAKEDGFYPMISFDENDPAWTSTGWGLLRSNDDETKMAIAQRGANARVAFPHMIKTKPEDVAIERTAFPKKTTHEKQDDTLSSSVKEDSVQTKHKVYESFFNKTAMVLQESIIEGHDSGLNSEAKLKIMGELVQHTLNEIPKEDGDVTLYFALGSRGYIGNGLSAHDLSEYVNGFSSLSYASACLDPVQFDHPKSQGARVFELKMSDIKEVGIENFPSYDDIQEAASNVIDRLRDGEINISQTTSIQAMRDQLKINGFEHINTIPKSFDLTMLSVLTAEVEKNDSVDKMHREHHERTQRGT